MQSPNDMSAVDLYVDSIFEEMVRQGAADVYLTVGSPPAVRSSRIVTLEQKSLRSKDMEKLVQFFLDEEQHEEFHTTLEYNTSYNWKDTERFRLNFFFQQGHIGIVIRHIQTTIPTAEELKLLPIYTELVMRKKGLILITGTSGAGKSTSLAAMLGHRNMHGSGHVITIEDPIEYVHQHNNCIFTQREVGIDTYSFSIALKNVLRQRADVLLIGEIRDSETMHHAINVAETGSLCLATLHASNTAQALERIIHFFPEEMHSQMSVSIAEVLQGIISQRLIPNRMQSLSMVSEVLLNVGIIHTLIQEQRFNEVREAMERTQDDNMQTFDQALLRLYEEGAIEKEIAIAESDNPANLKLRITQSDSSGNENGVPGVIGEDTEFTQKHRNILGREL